MVDGQWSMVNGRWSRHLNARLSTVDYRPSTFHCLLVALALTSCANTFNYTDPGGPRYSGVPSKTSEGSKSLKVVSFNIKYARAVDSAIAVLEGSSDLADADIIALQEMDESGAARIAAALGMGYVYYPAVRHPVTGQDFGPALLSKWPIDGDRKIVLPHLGLARRSQRVAVTARIVVNGRNIQVYAVHLANPLEVWGVSGQKDQLRAILQDADSTSLPVVIAGDFNSRDVGVLPVSFGYAWPTANVGSTHHGFDIDHVFVRGLGAPADMSAASISEVRGASDHRPVWARVPL